MFAALTATKGSPTQPPASPLVRTPKRVVVRQNQIKFVIIERYITIFLYFCIWIGVTSFQDVFEKRSVMLISCE